MYTERFDLYSRRHHAYQNGDLAKDSQEFSIYPMSTRRWLYYADPIYSVWSPLGSDFIYNGIIKSEGMDSPAPPSFTVPIARLSPSIQRLQTSTSTLSIFSVRIWVSHTDIRP